MPVICLCCGGSYEKRPHANPNICSGCEQLLEDDFPASTSHLLELEQELKAHPQELPPVSDPSTTQRGVPQSKE